MNPYKRYSKMDQYRMAKRERRAAIVAAGLLLWFGFAFIVLVVTSLPW